MSKFSEKRIFILNDPFAPRLCPELAVEIGFNESILFLQLEFWIAMRGVEREGRLWIRKSVREFQDRFPFWSIATINRTVQSLEEKSLIFTDAFNEKRYDKTRWFALNLPEAAKLTSIRIADAPKATTQNETALSAKATTQNETALSAKATTQNETAPPLKMKRPTTQNETAPFQNGTAHIRNNKRENIKENIRENKRERETPAPRYPEGLSSIEAVRLYYDKLVSLDPHAAIPSVHAQTLIESEVSDLDIWRKTLRYWFGNQYPARNVATILEVYHELVANGGRFARREFAKSKSAKSATASNWRERAEAGLKQLLESLNNGAHDQVSSLLAELPKISFNEFQAQVWMLDVPDDQLQVFMGMK